jgi:hypothetical protein
MFAENNSSDFLLLQIHQGRIKQLMNNKKENHVHDILFVI